jgi:hypothetical protein
MPWSKKILVHIFGVKNGSLYTIAFWYISKFHIWYMVWPFRIFGIFVFGKSGNPAACASFKTEASQPLKSFA